METKGTIIERTTNQVEFSCTALLVTKRLNRRSKSTIMATFDFYSPMEKKEERRFS